MTLKGRSILIIGIVGIIIIFLFFLIFLYRPRIASRLAVHNKIKQVQARITEIRALGREIERLKLKIKELEEANQQFIEKVTARDYALELTKKLASEAQKYEVRFLTIRPPGLDTLLLQENEATPIRPIPFEVTCQGKYLDIGRFIESLKDFPFYIKVYEIEMTGKSEIRPAIEARLLINIYSSSLFGRRLM